MKLFARLARIFAQPSHGGADQTGISGEQERLLGSLQESERKFRLLFESMTSGFALHEIIRDAAGKPIDYRYLQVNPAFEVLTGLIAEDIIGKTALEVTPDIERFRIERYARVVATGTSVRFRGLFRAPTPALSSNRLQSPS